MPSDDSAGKPLTLRGWYLLPRNRAAVILLHGAGCNRLCVFDYAKMFNRNGYGMLLFDLRAQGDSEGDTYRAGWKDVIAAVAFLHTRSDVDQIGVWGVSLGGIAAIQGAALTSDVSAVVADGAIVTTLSEYPHPTALSDWFYVPYEIAYYNSWPSQTGETLTPMTRAVAQISPRPIMLIAADGGGTHFEFNCAQALFSAAAGPKSLWVVPGVGHGGGFSGYPQEYEQRVIGFFNKALLPSISAF